MKGTDPLLRELLLETPWNSRVLEHAIDRARAAYLDDGTIRRLIAAGGPDHIHTYVAAMKPHMLYDCWCGERHWDEPLAPDEAMRNFGHLLIESLRIPELVDWLSRKLAR